MGFGLYRKFWASPLYPEKEELIIQEENLAQGMRLIIAVDEY